MRTGTDHAVTAAAGAAESDARIERMDRVAVLYAEITAATRAFLAALAASDRHRDWAAEGFGSCAEWLTWRLGITRNTANEKVRAARALEHLPLISRAMERGELSFSKVRALTRAATPDNEAELLAFARAGSAAALERLIRGWKTLDREGEAGRARRLHASRRLSVFADGDGMYVVHGRLTPEVAAALMRAIEAASDALFAASCEDGSRDVGAIEDDDGGAESARRRADALGLVAERALAAGFAGGDAPVSGSRAERYQVVLHVDAGTLAEQGEPGRSELDDGTRITAETARRLACDASLVRLAASGNGAVLGAGRRTRTIPPALRRALEARDRGCRFPGCGLRFTDGHHVVHWADGGETTLANLVLLCRRHHRAVHEGGVRVCTDREGRAVFFTPEGRALADAPPTPELPSDPVSALIERNRARGIAPDARAGAPRWRYDRDVPWAIEAAAREALDPVDEGPEGARPPLDGARAPAEAPQEPADEALDPSAVTAVTAVTGPRTRAAA